MNKKWFLSTGFLLLLLFCCSPESTEASGQDTQVEQGSVDDSQPEENVDDNDGEGEEPQDNEDNPEDTPDDNVDEGGDPEEVPVGPKGPRPVHTYKVLFVGNSLTYYNDLPKVFEEEASRSYRIIETDMVALANAALLDHWHNGNVQEMIKTNGYDFVVIQQGPSSQAYGRQILLDYGRRFKDLCDQYGAELVYYMVWPAKVNYHTFDAVIANHREAAEVNDALLAPVGEEWKDYFDTTGNFSYYGSDDFHPSEKGTEKAAEIIAETLFP
jgi:hypothetical protein